VDLHRANLKTGKLWFIFSKKDERSQAYIIKIPPKLRKTLGRIVVGAKNRTCNLLNTIQKVTARGNFLGVEPCLAELQYYCFCKYPVFLVTMRK
jgi:hypothetical protein